MLNQEWQKEKDDAFHPLTRKYGTIIGQYLSKIEHINQNNLEDLVKLWEVREFPDKSFLVSRTVLTPKQLLEHLKEERRKIVDTLWYSELIADCVTNTKQFIKKKYLKKGFGDNIHIDLIYRNLDGYRKL